VKGRGSSDGSSGTILNSGTINANRFNAPYSTVTNSGTINLHNKAGQDGHSYAGAFNQRASGTLSTDANITTGGTSTHPDINATNVSIADSSTINVNVISASDTVTHSFLDNNGTVNGVVISQNSIDANVAKLNITDDSPILDFEAFMNDSNTSLSLKAVEASVIKPQDKPLVSVSTSIVGMETLNVLDTVVQARQNSSRGLGSGDIAFKDKHIWFKPFGMYTKQDDKDGIYGFDANTYGFGIGVDGEYKAGNRAGLAFFYSYANIDINYVSQSNDMNVFNLIVYGSNPIVDDKTMLFYQAGAGVQRNNAKRYVSSTTQTAKADFTSKSFYVQAKAARSYNINDKLTLAPAIKGVLRYFYTPSYIESGADIGGNNLHVDSASTTQVILGLLTNLEYKINDSTNFISNVALNYDFNNDANSVYASYVGGTVFTTKGIKNSAFNYELGLGVSKQLKKDLMFNVKYDLSGRGSDFINHAIMAKFKWTF
jgi:outer membrane autotransporter protein